MLYIQLLNSLSQDNSERKYIYNKIQALFEREDPVVKEKSFAVKMVWHRMKNKDDPEDILMDAKVDDERIY